MVAAGMDPCIARALAACKHAKSVENAKKWHGKSWFGSTNTGAVAEGQKPVTDVKWNTQLAYLGRGGRVRSRNESPKRKKKSPQKQQPNKAVTLIRAGFGKADLDHDGKISRDEYKAAFGSMKGFDLIDLDGDGFVDLEEYVSGKLHRAARVNNAENLELLEAIAAHMPHLVDNNDPYGVAALWGAARKDNTDAMRNLLGAKADSDHKDEKGMTPIFIAAKEGNADAVQLLLESGANVNRVDKDRKTPVSIALAQGHREIALLLRNSGGVK